MTEARTVKRWSKEDREKYYSMVKDKRGEAAMWKLYEDVKLIWSAE